LGAAIANLMRVPLYPRNARESHLHMLAHTGCRDSCLHLAPISHGSGGRNVMVEKFDPVTLPDLMNKERTAYMFMVPTILNATNRIPGIERKKFPPSQMHAGVGCADLRRDRPESLRDLRRRHVSGLWPDRGTTYCEGSGPLRACSMPLPFARLQIWDEDNNPVQPGKIVAKCEGQMRGFWNNPEATAERIVDG